MLLLYATAADAVTAGATTWYVFLLMFAKIIATAAAAGYFSSWFIMAI